MLTLKPLKFEEAVAPEGKPAGPPSDPVTPAVDEFGYTKDGPEVPVVEKKAEAPVEKPVADSVTSSTGYEKAPPKVEEAKPAEVPPVVEPKIELGYELDAKDLDSKEVTKIKEFAKTHSLTKEAAQAFLDQKLSETKAATKSYEDRKLAAENAVKEVKINWDKELRTDKTFGGENFERNIMQAERVLSEMMPETKKALTERKSMLPPYVMRDLAKLAETLYKPEKMIQGESSIAEKKNEKEVNHLDFYT